MPRGAGLAGDPHRVVLLPRIIAVQGDAAVAISLQPRAGYGQQPLDELHRQHDLWTGRSGDLQWRWSHAGAARTRSHRQSLQLELALAAGQHHDLVLELSDRPLRSQPPDAATGWQATETAWRAAVPVLDKVLDPRDTRHSYAVLRAPELPATGSAVQRGVRRRPASAARKPAAGLRACPHDRDRGPARPPSWA
jgi:hypothetical protein